LASGRKLNNNFEHEEFINLLNSMIPLPYKEIGYTNVSFMRSSSQGILVVCDQEVFHPSHGVVDHSQKSMGP
jgi:hypothetical protein